MTDTNTPAPQPPAEAPQPAAQSGGPNLEAILHIPLEVSVELGRVEMPLHELARLGRGAVVDMQREASAEVEVLANGVVFARGEVVAVGDRLGVRITEILPPSERLASLGRG